MLSLGDGWPSEDHSAILSGFVYVEIFLYKLLVLSLDFDSRAISPALIINLGGEVENISYSRGYSYL
jgi:hypothetical protein